MTRVKLCKTTGKRTACTSKDYAADADCGLQWLKDNDKDKIEVFDAIKLSVCDNFEVELEYIFEKI